MDDSYFCPEFLIIGAVVIIILFICYWSKRRGANRQAPPATSVDHTPRQSLPSDNTQTITSSSHNSAPEATVRQTQVSSSSTRTTTYPTPANSASSVKRYRWVDQEPSTRNALSNSTSNTDLVDALTGARLDFSARAYQCQQCKVMYQVSSYEFLRERNHGKCVSCENLNIVPVTDGSQHQGINVQPNVVSLANYRNYVGRVITFRGVVVEISESRRGGDYFLFFEIGRTLSARFKLVIFRNYVDRFGGALYLYSLLNQPVDVRGVLQKHDQFGFEILLNDPNMLSISR